MHEVSTAATSPVGSSVHEAAAVSEPRPLQLSHDAGHISDMSVPEGIDIASETLLTSVPQLNGTNMQVCQRFEKAFSYLSSSLDQRYEKAPRVGPVMPNSA